MIEPRTPLFAALLSHAAARPEQPAILAGGDCIAYGRLAGMIRAAAARLRGAGQGRGARVVLWGPNSAELAAAYFAVHAAGGVAVLIDSAVPPEQAAALAAHADAHCALIAAGKSLPLATASLADFCRPDAASSAEATVEPPTGDLDDAADLLYTTGTSGDKKGVLLTHRQIAHAAANICSFLDMQASDFEVMPLPLAHSFGLGRLRCLAHAGHTLALEPGMRNPAATLGRLLDLRATGMAIVPAGIDILLRMTKGRLADAREHLRYVEIGSAPLRLESKRELMELLPRTRLCHHYGLTEASRAAFLEYHADRARLDSIGRASPNVEIAIHDGAGRRLPADAEGEIVVRGGMVLSEYWKQPELTRSALHDGWLRTGDYGRLAADGYLYLSGRQSDVINVGGRKVHPEEIERALDLHPAVVESACAGVPDPQGITGQCVQATVVLRAEVSEETLIGWLRERIEEYKIPRVWRRVERLEKTASGKIRRIVGT